MRIGYVALIALSGAASAFFIYLGVSTIDVVVSVFTLIYWAVAPFVRPLPKPLGFIHMGIGLVLLAAFGYFAALRILSILRL
ncbi:hypothetical protein [Pyrobaculum aerophilum]|uniref:Respiratory chain protein n=1 Tax=Pyrobaculum aerophilum TaxID=13773 RepID=A0A371QV65_9CREN|nr:hypothetical protein [Pyrobaculum aerophilum]MCX8137758.1 hypothetical protein [Pyrobaculum aerophilum]RFA93927.1 hypothetical protein CGL51_11785 [Pyrobaculum aerophilum]RFA97242.1 hypothetical protein CGL52_09760 [Pyrobaculum aerophilum]